MISLKLEAAESEIEMARHILRATGRPVDALPSLHRGRKKLRLVHLQVAELYGEICRTIDAAELGANPANSRPPSEI
jgi:hypothetical protein